MENRENLNLGSSRPSSVFVQLDGVIDRINNKMNLVLMRGQQFVTSLTSGMSKLSGVTGGMAPGDEAQSSNVIMSQPPITIPWQAPGQPSINRVMDNPIPLPGGGGQGTTPPPGGGAAGGVFGPNWNAVKNSVTAFNGDFRNYLSDNKIALGMTAGAFAFAATPDTREGVYLNYMTNRTRFYGASEPGGPATADRPGSDRTPGFLPGFMRNRKEEEYNSVSALQRRLSTAGTVTDKFDVVQGMASAQAYGLGAANPAYERTMTGVMQMTNLMPGLTAAEAAKGFMTGMQNARSVNMMRFIGIQARDPVTGALRSPTEIADQLWQKINREKVGKAKLTEQDLAISLQPGNALGSMLDQFFGQDPVARKFVEDALYAKVRGASDFSSGEMERIGATTQAVRARSERNTRALQTSQQTARAAAGGQAAADTVIASQAALINAIDRLTGVLSGVSYTKGFTETFAGAANNVQGNILSLLLGNVPIIGNFFKAEGGPVEGKVPYVVGEKGPELFVPKVDGTIVPNHQLGMFREGGGDVSAMGADLAGSKKGLSDKQLRTIFEAAGFKKKYIDTAIDVARAESGGIPGRHSDPSLKKDDSYGLFQVNMLGQMGVDRHQQYLEKYGKYGYKSREDLYNPYINAMIAADLSGGGANFTKHWVNTSAKLGLEGARSTSSGTPSFASSATTNAGTTFSDWLKKYGPQSGPGSFGNAQPGMGTQFGSAGGVSASNNYSVVINIKDASDAKKVAKEVKKILEDPTNNARN